MRHPRNNSRSQRAAGKGFTESPKARSWRANATNLNLKLLFPVRHHTDARIMTFFCHRTKFYWLGANFWTSRIFNRGWQFCVVDEGQAMPRFQSVRSWPMALSANPASVDALRLSSATIANITNFTIAGRENKPGRPDIDVPARISIERRSAGVTFTASNQVSGNTGHS